MSQPVQSFKNHARLDPAYHFFLVPLTFMLMIWAWIHHFRTQTLNSFFIAAAFLILLLTIILIRVYSLKVQDRVIRLEERIRLQSLGGEALQARIPQLTERQLIALRFASDAEAPALANRALDENLAPKQIKSLIQNWRGDFFRV